MTSTDINAALLITRLHQSCRVPITTTPNTPPKEPTPAPANLVTPQFRSASPVPSLSRYFSSPARLPSLILLNRYLAAYFLRFHPHLPFLHPPSFDPTTVAPALLFGVCSVGALICGHYETASSLQSVSQSLLSSVVSLSPTTASASPPLWTLQSLLTSIVFTSWSSDIRQLEFISSTRNFLVRNVSLAVTRLPAPPTSTSTFIDSQLAVRVYFSTFLLFSSLQQIFNLPSFLSVTDIPQSLPLPCSESLWNSISPSFSPFSPPTPVSFGSATSSDSSLSHFSIRILAACSPTPTVYALIQAQLTHKPSDSLSTSIDTSLLSSRPSLLLDVLKQRSPALLSAYFAVLLRRVRDSLDFSTLQQALNFHVPKDVAAALYKNTRTLMDANALNSENVVGLVFACSEFLRIIMVAGLDATNLVESHSPETLWAYFEMSAVVVVWCFAYESASPFSSSASSSVSSPTINSPAAELYDLLCKTIIDTAAVQVQGSAALTLAAVAADAFSRPQASGLSLFLGLTLKSFVMCLQPAVVGGRIGNGITTVSGAINSVTGGINAVTSGGIGRHPPSPVGPSPILPPPNLSYSDHAQPLPNLKSILADKM